MLQLKKENDPRGKEWVKHVNSVIRRRFDDLYKSQALSRAFFNIHYPEPADTMLNKVILFPRDYECYEIMKKLENMDKYYKVKMDELQTEIKYLKELVEDAC